MFGMSNLIVAESVSGGLILIFKHNSSFKHSMYGCELLVTSPDLLLAGP
jgi:hypothetical protein